MNNIKPIINNGLISFGIKNGNRGENIYCWRFVLTFKDASTLRRTINFTSYAKWMGQLREYAILTIANDLIPDMKTGEWGMVTNKSETHIYDELECFDNLEGHVWVERKYGAKDSSVDLVFDWYKVLSDGKYKRVAQSKMATTWVEVISHGVVRVESNPSYLENLLISMMPKEQRYDDNSKVVDGELKNIKLENLVYTAPLGPRQQPILLEKVYETSLEDSNLVGNIYYSNYYKWQACTRDKFFQSLVPDYFLGTSVKGEFMCTDIQVGHLREAMPFDQIKVIMSLKSVFENGVDLLFEYFNVSNGKEEKLAHGEHRAIWMDIKGVEGRSTPAKIPEKILNSLLADLQGVISNAN